MLWLIGTVAVGAFLAFAAGGLVGWGLILILLGLSAIYVSYGLRIVPVAHRGILMRFGKRTSKIIDEGWAVIIPFINDIVLEDFRLHTEDFKIDSLRSKDEAPMFARIKVSWRPKEDHLKEYIDKRGAEGVREILEGLTESEMRQYVARTDWRKVKSLLDDIETDLKRKIRDEIPVIEVTILSVMDADLVSNSQTAQEADREAGEKVQRRSQKYETETIVQRAVEMKKLAEKQGITLEVDESLIRFLMTNDAIREGHGEYHEFGGRGLEQLLSTALETYLKAHNPKEAGNA